jgi:hypothetical protein
VKDITFILCAAVLAIVGCNDAPKPSRDAYADGYREGMAAARGQQAKMFLQPTLKRRTAGKNQ